MFTINVNCICYEKGQDKTVLPKISGVKVAPCLLPKISGVEVTPSVTSVESSEQFWRKIRQIWRICEPWTVKKIMWIFTDRKAMRGKIYLEHFQLGQAQIK